MSEHKQAVLRARVMRTLHDAFGLVKGDVLAVAIVPSRKGAKNVIMNCPCKCGRILTLNVDPSRYPVWRYSIDRRCRLSLSPSVSLSDGCRSHFFVQRGVVLLLESTSRRRPSRRTR